MKMLPLIIINVLLLTAIAVAASNNEPTYPSDFGASGFDNSCFTKEKDSYAAVTTSLTTDAQLLNLNKAAAYHQLALMHQKC